jgi:glutathione peroxidase
MNKLYDYIVTDINGQELSLETYRDKILLIVNTASKCGFTPQYAGLEKLYQTYHDQGLVVLGFPCNQFANQEPGDPESIKQGCLLNYGVTFPMNSKVDVNGKDAHPLFTYLKDTLPGKLGKRIPWNFTKFLVDHEGVPYKRFSSKVKPEEIINDIEDLLKKKGALRG